MQSLPLVNIQLAIYDRLTTHASMTSYATGVTDNEDKDLPVTRIGLDWNMTDDSDFDEGSEYEGTTIISVYTAAEDLGGIRLGQVMNGVHEALTSADLTVTGWTVQIQYLLRFSTGNSMHPVTQNEERVAQMEYAIRIEKTA